MNPTTNEKFKQLVETIQRMGEGAYKRASDTEEYRTFIREFPLARLPNLNAEEYCVGKGGDTFCRWLERGLEPALGRSRPGTSKGHIVYFRKEDGSFYKNRHLKDLSDEEALRYTLKIQSVIAAADITRDISWIDDDATLYRRAGVEPRVTVGNGRKLRLLACYHPEDVVLISSSEHLGHFLEVLGCPKPEIPDIGKPVARMLKLREYFTLAKATVPNLSTRGFMLALYSPTLGIAPVNSNDAVDEGPDDEDAPAFAYLLTWNPDNFALGGDGDLVVGTEQRWTCHSKQPKVGDTVYLARLGVEPRGIVATGNVTEESHEAPHWRDPTTPARYIRFRVSEFRPDATSGLVPMVLLSLAIPDQKWTPQRSGIGLSAEVATALQTLWQSGAGVHSLRQYVTWFTHHPNSISRDWLESYLEVTSLARSIRENPSSINEASLDRLWRLQDNGVTNVGQGILSSKEFKDNLPLLDELTREIFAKPTAETLTHVEEQWRNAVSAKTLSKMNRVVIRRVFAAISPQTLTTVLRENDCQKLLALFKRQFELSANPSAGTDWVALNADITSCMTQAGLDPKNVVENNTAVWHLLEQLAKRPEETSDPEAGDGIDPAAGVTPGKPISSGPTANLVLYGPPGTGKTYQAVTEAIKILAPELLEGEPDRRAIKARFDAFVEEGRIVFTTFHQSFSYEDFVEGLRAEKDDGGQLRFTVVDGIFKLICNPRSGSRVRDAGQPNFSVGETFAGYQVIRATTDVLEIRKPNGNYLPFGMTLLTDLATLVQRGQIAIDDIRQKQVFAKVPETSLEPYLVNGYANILPLLVEKLVSTQPSEKVSAQPKSDTLPRVLIIDEINRGNISRIFGELITLIEPSKREGMPEALTVKLPYSKEAFCVPAHLHIIATMNTADRSLVGLDIALRRRFEFREIQPNPDLLDDVAVGEVSVGKMLRVMNERIEVLLDRDHRLGHTYFLSLREMPTLEQLARIFRNNVLPLLQEYFFEDWQRIRWVLNDHRKPEMLQFVTLSGTPIDRLFGTGTAVNDNNSRWNVNDHAFTSPAAYAGIINATQ